VRKNREGLEIHFSMFMSGMASEAKYSSSGLAMLCLRNYARVQTVLVNIQVSKYHRGKTRTFYYRRSISRQVGIFSFFFKWKLVVSL